MAAFFSGTDTATLRKEGSITPNFVSLVVNDAGQYVAAVTNRITIKKRGMRSKGYMQFGDKWFFAKEEPFEETTEAVEIFSLNVDKRSVPENYLVGRIKEIESKKSKSAIDYSSFYNRWGAKEEPKNSSTSLQKSKQWEENLFSELYDYPSDNIVKTPVSSSEPDDFDYLVEECAMEILYAPSNLTVDTVCDGAIDLISTYSCPVASKKFVKAIEEAIKGCIKTCKDWNITWSYIYPFVQEKIDMYFEDAFTEEGLTTAMERKLKDVSWSINKVLDNSIKPE